VSGLDAFGLALFVALGLALFGLVRLLHFILGVARLSRARRRALERALPAFETVVALVFLVGAAPLVVDEDPRTGPLLVLAVLVGLAWVGRRALSDFVDGMLLKVGRGLAVGDRARVGEGVGGYEGVVRRLGYRGVTLETARGEEVHVPFSALSAQALVRVRADGGLARHTFSLRPPAGVRVAQLHAAIERAALECHWAVPSRAPVIAHQPGADGSAAGGVVEVTVFAFAAPYAPDVEVAVREAVASLEAPGASPGAARAGGGLLGEETRSGPESDRPGANRVG